MKKPAFTREKLTSYQLLKGRPYRVIGLLMLFIIGLISIVAIQTNYREMARKTVPIAEASPTFSSTPTISPTLTPNNAVAINRFDDTIASNLQIPILMYHYIRDYHRDNDKVGNNLSVSPAIFAQHLQTLKNAGYQTIDFNHLATGKSLPAKPIILTFDDGYADAYTAALPALIKEGMTGVFYVVSGYLDKPNYLTSDQVKELVQAGMQIGAHTVSHANLAKMSLSRQRQQLAESRATLEQLIGESVLDFCYPSGQYNQETIRLLTEFGYRSATTVQEGIAKGADLHRRPYELPRIRVTEGTNLLARLGESDE